MVEVNLVKDTDVMNDIRIFFDEAEHKYSDNLGNFYQSVTQLLHQYQPKFNKAYWLEKKANELGISKKTLEKQWQTITDEACARGSKIHGGLEDGIKGASQFAGAVKYLSQYKDEGEMITVYDIPTMNAEYKLLDIDEFIDRTNNKYKPLYDILRKYVEHDYKLYSEIGVFLHRLLISGCIDVLCLREDRFQILDWKTNRGGLQFTSGYYKKDKSVKPAQQTNIWVDKKEFLLPPLVNLPNCNGSLYSMQLSTYARMVEEILGIPCINLCLCHIDCDFELNDYGMPKRFEDGLYHIKDNPVEKLTFYKIPYLKNEVEKVFEDRKKSLINRNVTNQFKLFRDE